MRGKELDRELIFEGLPVHKSVLKLVVPSVISQIIGAVYSLADTFFVGRLNDPTATAAVTVAVPVYIMTSAIANLFGVGGASRLAQALGRKEPEKSKQIASISFWCGLGAGILFSILALLFMRPILTLAGATSATYAQARGYALWTTVYCGPPTVMNVMLGDLIRSEGNSKVSSFGVSLGAVLNIILDPVFILPEFLGMGAVGAGVATGLSNVIGFLFFLTYLLTNRHSLVKLTPKNLKYTKEHIKGILLIGFPSALQLTLTLVAASALSKFASGYPTEAVAAIGIARRLVETPLYFSIGVANGLLPILAYHYAAKNQERRRKSFAFGCLISISISALFVIGYEIFAPQLAHLFIAEPTTIGYAADFARIQILVQPLVAFNYPMIIQFQALGKAKESLICSILRKGTLDIPFLFIANKIAGLYGLVWVQLVIDTIAFIVALAFYRNINREERARLAAEAAEATAKTMAADAGTVS